MKKIDSMFPVDNSLSGHGLTLTKVYRSYKGSPHNVNATYLKYLVHRLENADKYKQATPDKQFKMDIDFLDHHQRGGAAVKNGRMRASDLEEFMKNPDTPKLAKQLLNHKKQLIDLIQKEHADHIVNINGEPHLRLTRGLNVDRANRGADHALASYADDSHPPFGTHMHHQLVPLKNVWFAYDYGPKEATFEEEGPDAEIGNEDEFLVSPHQIVYNEEHKTNPTKNIVYRNFHNLDINENTISDYVTKKDNISKLYKLHKLKDRPSFNEHHLQALINNVNFEDFYGDSGTKAFVEHVANHKLLNQNHIQTLMEKIPKVAKMYLSNHPIYQAKYGNKVQKSLQKSTKISKQLSNKVKQLLSSKAVLNKTRGTLKFPKILPKDTRPEENVKQIPKNEPEHEMYGGLYTVKPAKQQFMESALTGVPPEQRYRGAQQIQEAIQGGMLGAYTHKTKQAFALEPGFAVKGHEAIHAMVDKAAAHFGVDEKQVYEHLNSLIHPEDKEILAHTLKTTGYPPHVHYSEMVPWIHTILHHKPAREYFFNSLKFYKNNVDETKQRQAVQRLGRTWNAIVKMGKELDKLP